MKGNFPCKGGTRPVLRIENLKLPPGAGMADLTAEAAQLLRVRDKDLISLRVLRRS